MREGLWPSRLRLPSTAITSTMTSSSSGLPAGDSGSASGGLHQRMPTCAMNDSGPHRAGRDVPQPHGSRRAPAGPASAADRFAQDLADQLLVADSLELRDEGQVARARIEPGQRVDLEAAGPPLRVAADVDTGEIAAVERLVRGHRHGFHLAPQRRLDVAAGPVQDLLFELSLGGAGVDAVSYTHLT